MLCMWEVYPMFSQWCGGDPPTLVHVARENILAEPKKEHLEHSTHYLGADVASCSPRGLQTEDGQLSTPALDVLH